MIDLRPVLFTLGSLIVLLAAGMILPTIVDLYSGNSDWQTFAVALFLTALIGGMLMLARSSSASMTCRPASCSGAGCYSGLAASGLLSWLSRCCRCCR